MYLKYQPNGDLVEILDIASLIDPCRKEISGCFHAGEERQEPATFSKSDLRFPSDEALPQCWINPDYRK